LPDPVVDEELELLDLVSARLEALPATRTASEAPLVMELERLRSIILSGDESKDVSALVEQYHHQNAVLKQLRSAGTKATVDPGCPYFAHLQLREGELERDLCLGRATCIKSGLRIVDWRDAPISKIFYSYRQGEEYDEVIAERERVGRVLVRRLVRILDGVLNRVQAPEGDFSSDPSAPDGWRRNPSEAPRLRGGQAAAVRAHVQGQGSERRLGSDPSGGLQRADKRLPEITGLIDPEQFELITRPDTGFLVIRGSAGSGKTTVALHRVAYLAFDDPKIDGSQTLVVVFSRALRRYAEHLLPSLGLEKVRIVSYREWAAEERRRHFPRLPTRQREDAPALVQRMKLHPVLSAALEAQVARVPGPAFREQALDDWASVLTQPALIEQTCAAVAPGAFSSQEIERFVDWNRARMEELDAGLTGDSEALFELDVEDDPLLLRAWQLRVGPLRGPGRQPLRFRHVVVDEVQDFSALEIRILLECLGQRSHITLAGDSQQQVVENSGFTTWSEFFEQLGIAGSEVETLKIAYRSSREIVDFSHSLLGDLREESEPPIATRSGPPVELFQFGERGACVAFLGDALRDLAEAEPLASVAVLTPSPESSQNYYDGLSRAELRQLRHVTDQDFSFAAGIEVTEIEQVKGLEFDYVVLVDVNAGSFPDTPAAHRLLHVGATRAVHQLWLCSVGRPSPLVRHLVER